MANKPYPIHPYAEIFPLHDGQPLWELREDIKANGLVEPIILYQGKVLDGRRRQACCLNPEVNVKPIYETFLGTDDDALRYVISKNLHRRHLSVTERALIAAQYPIMPHGGDRKSDRFKSSTDTLTITEIAEEAGVSTESLKRAKKVLQGGTAELQEAVKDETFSLSAGAELASAPPERQTEAVEQARKIDSNGTIYIFSWKRLDEPLGRLVRAVDECSESHGKSSHFDKLHDLLGQVTDTIETWKNSI